MLNFQRVLLSNYLSLPNKEHLQPLPSPLPFELAAVLAVDLLGLLRDIHGEFPHELGDMTKKQWLLQAKKV
jgi:hypothetical protein